jgi:hypothetical protein
MIMGHMPCSLLTLLHEWIMKRMGLEQMGADSKHGPRSARVTPTIPSWTVTCAPWMLKKIGYTTGTEPTQEQAR